MTHATARPRRYSGSGEGDPRPTGPEKYGAVPIMSGPMHDGWCGFPARTRCGDRQDLAHCPGCGLFVRVPLVAPQLTVRARRS